METLKLIIFCSLCISIAFALTVEDSYKKYQVNIDIFLKISYNLLIFCIIQELKKLEAFNSFKENWNYAKEQVTKFENPEEAWQAHKKEHGLVFSTDEDSKRFVIFKENVKTLLKEFKMFVNGETLENPIFFSVFNLHKSSKEVESSTAQFGL